MTELPDILQKSISKGETLYFRDYIDLTERLMSLSTASSAGSPDYGIAFQDFFATSNEALDHMTARSKKAGEELVHYWSGRETESLTNLVFLSRR